MANCFSIFVRVLKYNEYVSDSKQMMLHIQTNCHFSGSMSQIYMIFFLIEHSEKHFIVFEKVVAKYTLTGY